MNIVACRTLTTVQVAKLTGASLRQLQYWEERGYVDCLRPTSSRVAPRHWPEEAVSRVRLLLAFRRKGIAAGIAAEIARALPPEARYVVVWTYWRAGAEAGWKAAETPQEAIEICCELRHATVMVRVV